MATGTFTYNALRTETLKEHIKTQRKIVSHSNSTRKKMFLVKLCCFPVSVLQVLCFFDLLDPS